MAVLGVAQYPNSPTLIVPGGRVVGVIYNIGAVAVQLSESLTGLNSPNAIQNGAFTDGFPLQPGDSFAILLGWDLPLYASALLPGALLTVILSYPCGALLSGRSAEGNAPDKFSNPPSSGDGSGSTPGAPLPVAPQPAPSGGGTSTPTSSGGTSSPTYIGSTPPRIVTATIA